jgi:hypothetical protein
MVYFTVTQRSEQVMIELALSHSPFLAFAEDFLYLIHRRFINLWSGIDVIFQLNNPPANYVENSAARKVQYIANEL